MTIDVVTDQTMYGYCTAAIRHAQDAGYEVIGVCITGPLEADEGYDADEVDAELSRRLGREVATYGGGDSDDEGYTAMPIVAMSTAS